MDRFGRTQVCYSDEVDRALACIPPIEAEVGEQAKCVWCHVKGVVTMADVGIRHGGLPVMTKVIEGCFCVTDLDFVNHQPIAVLKWEG